MKGFKYWKLSGKTQPLLNLGRVSNGMLTTTGSAKGKVAMTS